MRFIMLFYYHYCLVVFNGQFSYLFIPSYSELFRVVPSYSELYRVVRELDK